MGYWGKTEAFHSVEDLITISGYKCYDLEDLDATGMMVVTSDPRWTWAQLEFQVKSHRIQRDEWFMNGLIQKMTDEGRMTVYFPRWTEFLLIWRIDASK